MLVSRVICRRANGAISKIYNYTYDSLGNISSVRGNTNASYTYDSQGQLLTETLGGTTYTYTYDTYGNIRSKSVGTTTVNYTYGSSDWLDLLTEYNGNSIDYDAIGNPTTWYDGTNFTWVNGRRLAGAANTENGLNVSYTYDNTGLRLSKTVNGVEHKYIWNNGKLVSEYYNGTELEFFYDESGYPAAFSYKANTAASPVYYYYLRNLQGDITGIVNSYGSMVANYSYNAWGKLLDIQSYSNGDNIAAINPLRYRGYYYDTELGLYYLQSRYYDPELGRFINADDVAYLGANKDFGSFNLFAYCGNNPAALSDPNGRFSIPQLIIAATVGGLISGISTYLQTGDIRQSIDSGLSGALTGAFCSVGKWPFILAGAIISGIHTAFTAEGSFFKKLVMGITNFGFVTLTGWFGNKLTDLLGNELKNFGEFLFDAEFGTVAIIFDYTIQSFFTTPEKSDVQISVCPHHIGSAQRSEIIRCI